MDWKIIQLDRETATGLVTTAHWTLEHTDDEYSASAYGSVNLPTKDSQDESFIAYESLTESQVIDWVKAVLGDEVAQIEGRMISNIQEQKAPVRASGVPW